MLTYAFAIDSAITCVDKYLLSDKTLMELFVETFNEDTKNKFAFEADNLLHPCAWNGVQCDVLGSVKALNWNTFGTGGTLYLEYLPTKVESVELVFNSLLGTIDSSVLPQCLEILNLAFNRLTGGVDLRAFPFRMREICLQSNNLQGCINLGALPEGLEKLNLGKNSFRGEVDLRVLPINLCSLGLRGNRFDRVIQPDVLPEQFPVIS